MPRTKRRHSPPGMSSRAAAERGDDAGQHEDVLEPVVDAHDRDVAARASPARGWSASAGSPRGRVGQVGSRRCRLLRLHVLPELVPPAQASARCSPVEERVDAEGREHEQGGEDRHRVAAEREQEGQRDVEVEDREQQEPRWAALPRARRQPTIASAHAPMASTSASIEFLNEVSSYQNGEQPDRDLRATAPGSCSRRRLASWLKIWSVS